MVLSDSQLTLAALNGNCAELVIKVNTIIDEEFELEEMKKKVEHFTKLSAKYYAQVEYLQSKQKELRKEYVILKEKLQGNETEARKTATKLYKSLRKEYEKRKLKYGDPIPDVREWEIPPQLKVPRAVEPKVSAERSKISSSLARRLFKLKNHHRMRTHLTHRRAEAQINQLKDVLATKRSQESQRQLNWTRLESNIAVLQDSIERMRVSLTEPDNRVWYDAHLTYAEELRSMLIQIDESEGPCSTSISNLEVRTVPALTTVRRMSGPDINEAPHLLTQPNYRRSRLDRHIGGSGIESMFDAPLHVAFTEGTLSDAPEFDSLPKNAGPSLNVPVRPLIPMEEVPSYHHSLTRGSQIPRVKPKLSNLALQQLHGVPEAMSNGSVTSSDYGDGDNSSNRQALTEVSANALNLHVNVIANTHVNATASSKCNVFDENCAAHLFDSHVAVPSPSPIDMQGVPNTPVDEYEDSEESVFHSIKGRVSPLRINCESQSCTIPAR